MIGNIIDGRKGIRSFIALFAALAVVMTLMVALSAGVASASHQMSLDPDSPSGYPLIPCTFDRGTTSCVTMIEWTAQPLLDEDGDYVTEECLLRNSEETGYRYVYRTTTTITTTEYYGKSHRVKGETATTEETGPAYTDCYIAG